MIKKLILISLILAVVSISNAQDIIYKKDGGEIKAKILTFGSSSISYKIWEYQTAPSQTINTNLVDFIKYQNGTVKNTNWYGNRQKVTKGSFTDKRDGITYKTITFAGQTWMAENLRATKTTQGVDVTWIVSNSDWADMSYTDLGYCYYNNDPDNGKVYGCLYNWETAKNVCPVGWHLPADKEWTTFTNNIAKYFDLGVTANDDGNIDKVGGLLKTTGTLHWKSPNEGATNKLGFSALPSGGRIYHGHFDNLGNYGYWWSATEYNSLYAYNRYLNYNNTKVYRVDYDKSGGYSVRCVRDGE